MAKKSARKEAQDLKIENFNSKENLDNFENELNELDETIQEISETLETVPDATEEDKDIDNESDKKEKIFPKNPDLVAYFEGNFIPYCKTCWEQYRTNFIDGSPICPVNYENCPKFVNT